MGNEAKCVVRMDGKRHEGKALLETSELIFRSAECLVKIRFDEVRGVTAADGELRVKTKDGVNVFKVGSIAEKWREKILHPKTRAEKLGIKAGMKVFSVGDLDSGFLSEMKKSGAEIHAKGTGKRAEIIFLGVSAKAGLTAVAKTVPRMQGAAALWVVYPKGKKEITENDVLSAGRKAGLKDVKVVGFSPTHTALKFVIPLEKR
jgi:hypothetical protein